MKSPCWYLLLLSVVLTTIHPGHCQTVLYDFEFGDNQGWGSYGTITTDSGAALFGSIGFGRFHTGDFSLDDQFPDNPLLWGIVDVSPVGIDLSPYTGFSVDAFLQSVPGYPPYTGDKILDIGIETANGEFYDTPVVMTDFFQTFTVRFPDFVPATEDLRSARIKLRVLSSHGMGIGEFNYDEVVGIDRLSGDFNNDGFYDCVDVDGLVADIVGPGTPSIYDLTGDGNVDMADLTSWLAEAGANNLPSQQPYLPGDANLDGAVDGSDFGLWNSSKFMSLAAWCHGDFNADGAIDGSDFGLWNTYKFTNATLLVPEPAACWMILAGFTVIARRRRAVHRKND